MQLKEILQQPDTSDAVDPRDMKRDARDVFVTEVYQVPGDIRVVKISPTTFFHLTSHLKARVGLEIVKVPESAGSQQLVYRFAPVAAERFATFFEKPSAARFAAMKTAAEPLRS
jgi:hypothetical protein